MSNNRMMILMLCLLATTIEACKWLENLPVQAVDFRLENTGFHREYVADVKVTNMERFIECEVAYRVTIPRGAFIDMNSLNSTMINHCFNENVQFDVESPEYGPVNPAIEQIYFYSSHVIRKLFVVEEQLKFPVNLRYHSPSVEGSAEVTFKAPEVFVKCKNKTEIFHDKNCDRFAKKIPCGCGKTTAKCDYIRLNVQPGPNSEPIAVVPVGNPAESQLVLWVTGAVVGFLMLWILKELVANDGKRKTE